MRETTFVLQFVFGPLQQCRHRVRSEEFVCNAFLGRFPGNCLRPILAKLKSRGMLLVRPRATSPPPVRAATIGASVEQLDLATIIKVFQEVSGELVLEQLIDRLMRAALEHAGAERALLISERDGSARLEAEAATAQDAVTVRVRPGQGLAVSLPESMLQYVRRTRETVLLDDALLRNAFSGDPYFATIASGPSSVYP